MIVGSTATSNHAGADQLVALLAPDTIAAAGIDPYGPGLRVVIWPAYDGSVTVGGQRDGEALGVVSNSAGADQFRRLLRELRRCRL